MLEISHKFSVNEMGHLKGLPRQPKGPLKLDVTVIIAG